MKIALYFGCRKSPGHYLQLGNETIYRTEEVPGFPWTLGTMDTKLLRNGNHPDVYDGKVFWTCAGKPLLWFAFFWWDNSVDRRGGSNSGFYVRGFKLEEREEAFKYACDAYPNVVARQHYPLELYS